MSGMFSSSQTWKRDPSVAFSCQRWPCPLPTTFYHPDVADTPNMKTRPQCRVLRVWGVPAPFPLPSTTQTRITRPYGRVIRFWDIADTLNMKSRPRCHVLRVWGVPTLFPSSSTTQTLFPAPYTAQTRRTRPCGRVLHVWGIPPTSPWPKHGERDHCVAFSVFGLPLPHSGYKNMTHWVVFFLSIPFLLIYSMY